MKPPIRAFLEAEAAYREALEEVKALESARDDALLAASRELPIPELSAAAGLSKDRALRIINRASRRAAGTLGSHRTPLSGAIQPQNSQPGLP
jgi:hypothetical protein